MPARPRLRALTLLVALALPALMPGCLLTSDSMVVVASAPKASSGMTLFIVTDPGLLERYQEQSPEYAIYYGDRLIYPPAGKGASFDMDGRAGSAFVPYDRFVVGNGEYDVLVKHAGSESRARVHVEKWVEYVFLQPYAQGDKVVVEAALSSATGGAPETRILAHGEIILRLHYRGQDGTEDRVIGSAEGYTRHDRTSTAIEIPRSRFNQGSGWYSFEPVFHNLEARDNLQVRGDPTMGNRFPPNNWIHIR